MLWKRLEQHGDAPGARSSHAIAITNNRVYLFGGELQPRIPVPAETYAYDTSTSAWTKLKTSGTCPGPRIAATMAAIGDRVYLFGGRTGVDMGKGAQADMFVLDTAKQHWSAVQPTADSPTPIARSYHSTTAANGKIYIFGGCGASGRLNDLWEFTPESNNNSNGNSNSCGGTWKQLPSCKAVGARGGSVMVASAEGRFLYVMGGFNGAEMADCHSFDLNTNTWSCPTCCSSSITTVSSLQDTAVGGGAAAGGSNGCMAMPLARSVFGAAVHGDCGLEGAGDGSCVHAGHVVAFGGEVSPSDKGHAGAGNFTSAVYCLCPPTSACSQSQTPHAAHDGAVWHTLSATGEAPGPRGWFAAAVVPGAGDLLVHGGLGTENERLGDMYRLCMHA